MPPVFWKKKTRKNEVANCTSLKKKTKENFCIMAFPLYYLFPTPDTYM